ncbi:MAG TPA: tetratricopeptide repeat protein [Actinobacteria bacterium]|nr:tetratricopeptide repeat protein [Actinomycetes bacterium]HEX21126.1 tetratricopeptide repeat protein [Actinomycetota bacterium]
MSDNEEINDNTRTKTNLIILGVWVGMILLLIGVYVLFINKKTDLATTSNSQIAAKIKPFNERLAQNPNDLDAILSIGEIYNEAGKYPDALKMFQRALNLQPKDKLALTDAGAALLQMGQTNDGIAKIDEALTIDPNFDYALFMKASYLQQIKNDYQGSLKILEGLKSRLTDKEKISAIDQLIAQIKQKSGATSSTSSSTTNTPSP